MHEPLIKLNDIEYSVSSFLSRKSLKILSNINLEIFHNSSLGIIGQSGSGKTTLVKLIGGIIEPTGGKINYHSSIDQKSYLQIQILFQNNRYLVNPARKVDSLLNESMNKFGIDSKDGYNEKLISLLQIDEKLMSRFGYQLSGGELQRTALARILYAKPKLLILDEPFSAQDFYAQLKMKEILKFLSEELKITLLIVSHNVEAMEGLTDKNIELKAGSLV